MKLFGKKKVHVYFVAWTSKHPKEGNITGNSEFFIENPWTYGTAQAAADDIWNGIGHDYSRPIITSVTYLGKHKAPKRENPNQNG